jgi:hypothetical protein
MKYLGDFAAGATVRGTFQTRTKATGAPITLAGSPTLAVYKDGNTTETTTGVVLTVDFDSRTGHHLYAITTTDSFYATGSDYRIVITAGTVDGESQVGVEVGSFSIENRRMRGTDNALLAANYTTPPTSSANATAVRSELATELARIDANISSRSTYAGADTAGTATLLARLTADRAGYLDKLNVSGVLAHTDNATTFRADVGPLLTGVDFDSAVTSLKTDIINASLL